MITYKDGYKYQLVKVVSYKLPIQTGFRITCGLFLEITPQGNLYIKPGYAWDGCSGPTWDDKSNMKAGLIHDAMYQFMRHGLLDEDPWKNIADQLLYDIAIENGMNSVRAWYYKKAVEMFGHNSTRKPRKVYKV